MYQRQDAVRVSLAYRYHNPQWSLDRNIETYGDDHNMAGIGGNMTIWWQIKGELELKTQLLIPEKGLAEGLKKAKSLLDHRCLFEVEPWFDGRVPTLENIALFLGENLIGWDSLIVEENEHWQIQIFKNQSEAELTHRLRVGSLLLSLTLRGNIQAEIGLLMRRGPIVEAVKNLDWESPKMLFEQLSKLLPPLVFLRIQDQMQHATEWRRLT